MPDKTLKPEEEIRIGVYTCQCGGNIGDVVACPVVAKAIRLMAAGIAKSRLLEPLEPIRLETKQHALVIGGGVAGLRSALAIVRRGIKVTLIEKTPFLGGHMAQLEQVFPTGEQARELLS